jgi:hypothetical protein
MKIFFHLLIEALSLLRILITILLNKVIIADRGLFFSYCSNLPIIKLSIGKFICFTNSFTNALLPLPEEPPIVIILLE